MKLSVKDLCEIVIIAALYVALTLGLSPISYGAIQFRISEALMLLVIYKRKYSVSLVLACFIANLFSPVGWVDIIFGTLATLISVIPMLFIKRLEPASLIPSLVNGLIVGLELSIVYELPIALTIIEVFVGEFVVVSLIGVPLFKALENNEGFMRTLGCEKSKSSYIINSYVSLSFIALVVVCILFFRLPLDGEEYSLYVWLKDDRYFIGLVFILIAILSLCSNLLLKDKMALIFDIIIGLMYIFIFILSILKYHSPNWLYYFNTLPGLYYIILGIFKYKRKRNIEIYDSDE